MSLSMFKRCVWSLGLLLLSTAVLVVGDTNWNPWEPLPEPRAHGQAVKLFADFFLVGGEKQDATGTVVPALDVLSINVNTYRRWSYVTGAELPAPIKGRSFSLAVESLGHLWDAGVYPVFVCYACAESNTTSSMVATMWINASKAAVSFQDTTQNNIPRRLASFGQFTQVTTTGPTVADYSQKTYIFIFGGLDKSGLFVQAPESREVNTPNTKEDAWTTLRSPTQQMPLPWWACAALLAPPQVFCSAPAWTV